MASFKEKVKNWLQYRRDLREWYKSRPPSSFDPFKGGQQIIEIADKLSKWETNRPIRQKLRSDSE